MTASAAAIVRHIGGYASVVKALLEHGADPNVKSPEGTALDVARAKNKVDVIRVLQSWKTPSPNP